MLPNITENYLTRGFWGDEAWTSLISQLPYVQMLETTAADFHPPAYYSVIVALYQFAPPTEILTRLVSITFYLLTVFLVYKFASEVKTKKFGILAAVLVLVSPVFFTYAFEARNYTMFAFASTGSFYFLFRLINSFTWKNAFVFVLFSSLGVYTHYYMFFALAGQALYIVLFARHIFVKMVGVYFVTALTYLPWMPFLYSQVQSVGQSYWISTINYNTHLEAFYRVLAGEGRDSVQVILRLVSFVFLVISLFYFFIKGGLRNLSREWSAFILMWFWIVASFVLATLPGLDLGFVKLPFRSIFFWRYLIPTAIPFSILIASGIYYLPKNLKILSSLVVISLAVWISYFVFLQYPNTYKQVYENEVVPNITADYKIVTLLPSFAEVLYYRERNNIPNEVIVLEGGLVQFSGKSLLDAYVENGVVKLGDKPDGRYFELRPGPSVETVNGFGEESQP